MVRAFGCPVTWSEVTTPRAAPEGAIEREVARESTVLADVRCLRGSESVFPPSKDRAGCLYEVVGQEGSEEEDSPVTPDFFQLMDKDGESCRQWAVIFVANLAEFTEHLQFFPCLVQRKEMFILEEEECIVGKSLAEHRSEAVVGNEAVDAVFFWAERLDLGVNIFSIVLHVRS